MRKLKIERSSAVVKSEEFKNEIPQEIPAAAPERKPEEEEDMLEEPNEESQGIAEIEEEEFEDNKRLSFYFSKYRDVLEARLKEMEANKK
jgi:hypothetical protein